MVQVVYRFDSGKRRYSAAEAREFRAQLALMRRDDEPPLQFESEAASELASGRIAEGLSGYRRLIALHPREALHHAQLALALLDVGAGEAARKEAQAAIALEPFNALGFKALGWILQHDLLGRRFRPGFDHAGAVAAYQKAKALAPDDFESGGISPSCWSTTSPASAILPARD